MFSTLLEGISTGTGEKIAGDWLQAIFSPALLFWSGGLLAWIWHDGWHVPFQVVMSMTADSVLKQIVLAFLCIVLLIICNTLMTWASRPIFRLLEGYFPTPFGAWLSRKMVAHVHGQLDKKIARLSQLAMRQDKDHTPSERQELIALDAELTTHYPAKNLLPTKIGNLLRAAESYPQERYGLDSIIVWGRLWILLPEETRQELQHAQQRLDYSVQLIGWSILFLIWGIWAWWTIPVALLAIFGSYHRAIYAVQIYAELIRAVFDLHRFKLYEAMHFHLPVDSNTETKSGEQLTQYIFRGAIESVTFKH